jgi:predicted 3-demethylubiquinone-9 3-methyltransferase (glyoxalase superfamily)
MMKKGTIWLWYNHDAEEAARFYARTFPDSTVGAVQRSPSDFPDGKAGQVLTVEFTVCGLPCYGLNLFTFRQVFCYRRRNMLLRILPDPKIRVPSVFHPWLN